MGSIRLHRPNPKYLWGAISAVLGRWYATLAFGPPIVFKAKRWNVDGGNGRRIDGLTLMVGLVGVESCWCTGVSASEFRDFSRGLDGADAADGEE